MSTREKCRRCGGCGYERDWRGFGKAMRANRERHRIGLRQFAKRVGCSPAYLSDMERGSRSWTGPKAQRAITLLENLEVVRQGGRVR